eukprot:704523-Rhodomonas_salina.2
MTRTISSDVQALAELQKLYKAFEQSNILEELSQSEDEQDDNAGLRQEQNFDDFDGCPVKPASL